ANAQMEAIWAYMALGPGLPLPTGMEPPRGLIIKVGEKPEILRTFLPEGGGSRAIAVGYPAGVNIAFDAHAARLSYAWEGNFLDASPVWNDRGGNPAKLLGPRFYVPPALQPWTLSESAQTPPDLSKRATDFAWGAPVPNDQIFSGLMNVMFEGYNLNPAGEPSFRYRIRGPKSEQFLKVVDQPTPLRSGVATGLGRAFQVTWPHETEAWLLLGEASGAPRMVGKMAPVNGHEAQGAELVLPQSGNRAVFLRVLDPSPGSTLAVTKVGEKSLVFLLLGHQKTGADFRTETWAIPRDDDALLPPKR
ncbi:MAG: hypothetical protein ACRCZF_16710, partial [Gemmataceae bacterium]